MQGRLSPAPGPLDYASAQASEEGWFQVVDGHCEWQFEQLKTIHPGHNRPTAQCKSLFEICRVRNPVCIGWF
jgi:hypothetical protein